MRVLYCVTGSVAAVKTPEAVHQLLAQGHEVKVVLSKRGESLLDGGPGRAYNEKGYARFDEWRAAGKRAPPTGSGVPSSVVLTDRDEWDIMDTYAVGRDPVLHIELRKWADVMVVAPLSANTLAKMAMGMCDDLVTCTFRAWDASKPVVVAPAMNTLMWENKLTSLHLETLTKLNESVRVVQPISKTLACNDTGMGAMAPVERIVEEVGKLVGWRPARNVSSL